MRVRFQWQYQTDTFESTRRRLANGTLSYYNLAEQIIYNGVGIVCYRFNELPTPVGGSSSWAYRRGGTDIESVESNGNDLGVMAFFFPPLTNPPLQYAPAIPQALTPVQNGEPNYDMRLPFYGRFGGPASPNWSPDLCEWNEDITTTIGEGGPFGQYVRRNVYQYAFSDVGTAGAVTGTSNVDERDTRGFLGTGGEAIQREVASWSLAWQRDVLTCELGGPDQLQREPGCSNCGDRAKLEPFA